MHRACWTHALDKFTPARSAAGADVSAPLFTRRWWVGIWTHGRERHPFASLSPWLPPAMVSTGTSTTQQAGCALWPADGGGGWRPSTCPSHGPCMCPHANARHQQKTQTHMFVFKQGVRKHTDYHHHCPLTPAVLSPRLAVCKSKKVSCVVYLLLSLLAREAGGRKGLAGARGTSEQDETPRKFASLPISRLRNSRFQQGICVSTRENPQSSVTVSSAVRSLSLLIWTKARDPLCTLVHTRCFIRFGSYKITNCSR
jgi:hypothetical protein